MTRGNGPFVPLERGEEVASLESRVAHSHLRVGSHFFGMDEVAARRLFLSSIFVTRLPRRGILYEGVGGGGGGGGGGHAAV